MKHLREGLFLAALVVGLWPQAAAAQLPFPFSLNLGGFASRCRTDAEIPPEPRAAFEASALDFARAVAAQRPERAYSNFIPEVRQKMSGEQFEKSVISMLNGLLPVGELRVAHSYFVERTSLGTGADASMICTQEANGSVDKPEGRVTVVVKSISEQAHVAIEGENPIGKFVFTLWLFNQDGKWAVAGFWLNAANAVGKGPEEYWTLARAEKEKGRNFTAYIFYVTALQIANRGPTFKLGIEPEIRKELDGVPVPPELAGKPPFVWPGARGEHRVLQVGPGEVEGKFGLRIVQQIAAWNDDKEAEDSNRALLAPFVKAHPELIELFPRIGVRAVTADRKRFFTTIASP